MAFPTVLVTTTVSGTFYGVEAADTATSTALETRIVEPDSLTCLFAVLAEGDGITLTGRWQTSTDNSNWEQLDNPENTTPTILATGTSGSDTLTTQRIAPPPGWTGVRYIRAAVEVGGITGVTADTYSMTLSYQKRNEWR